MPEENATHFLKCEWNEADNQTLWDHWKDCKQGELVLSKATQTNLYALYYHCYDYLLIVSEFSKGL